MEFVNRFRAKNTKAAQAQSKLKQIERMDKVEAPEGDDRKLDFRFPQPQRSGLRVDQAGEHPPCLRRERGVSRDGFSGGARPAHRAGGAERRGQIHPAEDPRRRAHAAGGHAHARPQRQSRLLLAVSRGHAAPGPHRARRGVRHAAAPDRAIRPHPARLFPLPRRRCVQEGRGAQRRREEPAGAGEAAAGPAEPPAHGRADHAPGPVERRCAGLRARPVRRHAHLHQPRRLFHPRAGQPRRPRQRRPADALPRRLPVLPGQDQGGVRARGLDGDRQGRVPPGP